MKLYDMDLLTRELEYVQDGPKRPLLCGDCEQFLGISERKFRERLFDPFHRDRARAFPYDEWLALFAAGVVWRTAQFHLEESNPENWPSDVRELTVQAAERWRRFLRGEIKSPGGFGIHLLALSEDFAPEVYMRHALEATIAHHPLGDRSVFVKLGALLIVGVLRDSSPSRWLHTAIDVRTGIWNQHRRFKVPETVIAYVRGSTNELLAAASNFKTRRRGRGRRQAQRGGVR